MFNSAAGVRITHVPYKGVAPGIYDTLGGQVAIMFGVPEVVPHIKTGKLMPLGVTGAKRSTVLPNEPTIAEAGLPGFEVTSWHAMFAPAGTPTAIVQRVNAEVRKGLMQTDVAESLSPKGLDLSAGTAQELAAQVKSTTVRWSRLIKEAGIRVE
jgi:tripartite-type tricarboxylate transporter receptor subunit TctC